MAAKKPPGAVLRPKRQVTIPKKLCDELGIEPGDTLVLTVEKGMLIARPQKTAALEALREIQRAFAQSGITGQELQEEGRRQRHEIARTRYGSKP
jgi:AbrB family looped-hinge helix DNA binding protein